MLLKWYLGDNQFHSYEGVEMAVCELLQVIQPGFYGSRILNSFQDGTNASMCKGIVEKN
jgi:hypothetical protein